MIWRVAIRIARREAWRHKGRSALVAAMLALPVAGASAADTLYHTVKLSTAEQLTRDLGRADAFMKFVAPAPVEQLPDGSVPAPPQAAQMVSGALQGVQIASPIDAGVLPPGSRVIPLPAKVGVRVRSPHGYYSLQAADRDLGDPLMAGIYKQMSGRAPHAKGEVALSTSLLHSLGKRVGDPLSVELLQGSEPQDAQGRLPQHQLVITGEYDDPSHLDNDVMLPYPGSLPTAPNDPGPSSWLAQIPGGLSWQQVQHLNQGGYSAESRDVVLNPPPDSQVALLRDHPKASAGGSRLRQALIAVGAVGIVMALLEVVLLAGPAFAVGARKRRRDFGLMGAAGADGRMVRSIVLADGLVLGAVGGLVGALLGIAGGWALLPEATNLTHREPGAFRVAPGDLLVSAFLGVATGLVAALIPAIITGRQEVLESLTGGRKGVRGMPWKLALAGVATIAAGLAATGYGVFQPGIHTVPLVGGIAISELGVVACTPLLVALTGRLGRLLPLTGRMALRDSARNRGRTAPAVAAILAAVAGSTAVAVLLSTDDARQRAQYHSNLRPGQVALLFGPAAAMEADGDSRTGFQFQGMPADPTGKIDTGKAIDAIGSVLPLRSAAVIQSQDFRGFVPVSLQIKRDRANECPFFGGGAVFVGGGRDAESMIQADPRCSSAFGGAQIIPGDATTLRALTGKTDPHAEQILASGGVVLFDKYDVTSTDPGSGAALATLTLQRNCPPPGADQNLPEQLKQQFAPYCDHPAPEPVTLPAAVATIAKGQNIGGVRALIPQAVADRFGLKYQPSTILFDTTRMPTADEEERANAAAEWLGISSVLKVERGFQGGHDTAMLALAAVAAFVTLGAAAIATGLAITDGEADLETLAAVGARPRVRKALAGSQATVTAVMGSVLGSATGLVPAVAVIEARSHSFVQSAADVRQGMHAESYLTVPWWFVLGTVMVVPALAGIGAVLVTRSKVELRRRRG